MANKNNLGKEFKALGNELAEALKQIRSSKEFKDLEKEIGSSVKKVSSSLGRSLKAAKQSESTAKIKKRLGRVAKAGVSQGTQEAKKVQAVAVKSLQKILKNMRKLREKVDR